MMTLIVALSDGETDVAEYGPFPSRTMAERFAAFLGTEVDPARVMEVHDDKPPMGLLSPLAELLAWYENTKDGSA